MLDVGVMCEEDETRFQAVLKIRNIVSSSRTQGVAIIVFKARWVIFCLKIVRPNALELGIRPSLFTCYFSYL